MYERERRKRTFGHLEVHENEVKVEVNLEKAKSIASVLGGDNGVPVFCEALLEDHAVNKLVLREKNSGLSARTARGGRSRTSTTSTRIAGSRSLSSTGLLTARYSLICRGEPTGACSSSIVAMSSSCGEGVDLPFAPPVGESRRGEMTSEVLVE